MQRWYEMTRDAGSEAAHAPHPLGRKIVLPLLAVWLLSIAIGLAIAIDHDTRPDATATADARWPLATQLVRASQGATLVMFVHPECPCTRASLEQFESVLQSGGTPPLTAHIVVVGPEAETSRNAALARQIKGAKLSFDADGTEAQRFGSRTSGDLLIYDASGKLVFCGGITAGRGHQGDNLAAAAAKSAAAGSATQLARMPVFGCSLRDSQD